MPLPRETLDQIKERLDEAAKVIENLEDVILDADVAELDIVAQKERLESLKDNYRKLKLFYDRQSAKVIE